MSDNIKSREQQYLAYLAGDATTYPQDPYTRTELYLYKICQNSGSAVTPEEVQEAVDNYLEEHPVQPTPIDDTLTLEGYAADAKAVGNAVGALEVKIDNIETTSVEVGETITGDAGTEASVKNVGTEKNVKLQFTIPKGDKGEQGAQGDKGDKGDKGDDGYTPVKGTDYFTAADVEEIVNEVVEKVVEYFTANPMPAVVSKKS